MGENEKEKPDRRPRLGGIGDRGPCQQAFAPALTVVRARGGTLGGSLGETLGGCLPNQGPGAEAYL